MKGLTHFTIGVAVASCLPPVVRAAAEGNPLYFLLAGCAGLLPDTLDFKFARFLHRRQITVTPDPNAPDARVIAAAVQAAVHRALTNGRPVTLKLNTIQLSADRWRQYYVTFDVPARCVRVRLGAVVDTGGRPVPGEAAPAANSHTEAEVSLGAAIALDYLATTPVDILDGPVFRFDPTPEGAVRPVFIPWHRSWSHSLVIAAMLGLAACALWDGIAGLVVTLAYAAHALADQLGHMGSNLLAPFTRGRMPGLKWTRSMSPFTNFLAVWVSLAIVFWNLAAHADCPVGLDPLRYALVVGAIPVGLFAWIQRRSEQA